MPTEFTLIEPSDQALIEAAREALKRNYHPEKHTVGAAVLCSSGRTYTGINVEACGYGPCAEPIAIGSAFTSGEREILAIVAVRKLGDDFPVLSPCGNCRQLIIDYAPEATVIFNHDGKVMKGAARDLLPGAYLSGFNQHRRGEP